VDRGAHEAADYLCHSEQPRLPHLEGTLEVDARHRTVHRHGHPRAGTELRRTRAVDGGASTARCRSCRRRPYVAKSDVERRPVVTRCECGGWVWWLVSVVPLLERGGDPPEGPGGESTATPHRPAGFAGTPPLTRRGTTSHES